MIYTRQRTSSTAPWTTTYYVSDLWGTRLLLDSSGNVVGRQAHLPFGEEFGGSGTQEKHHFTTYESETESGTDYAVNRQYSQNVGRFGSADPYKASSYLVNPQSWNRYSYVLALRVPRSGRVLHREDGGFALFPTKTAWEGSDLSLLTFVKAYSSWVHPNRPS